MFILLKPPKNIEIQYFDLRVYKMVRAYPSPPTTTTLGR